VASIICGGQYTWVDPQWAAEMAALREELAALRSQQA
jgi:hypothetical protein